MARTFRRFWGSACLTAAGVAGGLGLATPVVLRLQPRAGVWLLGPVELWLLAVFTAGMLALLFGVSVALGGWFRGSAAREALEAWRREADRREARGEPGKGAAPASDVGEAAVGGTGPVGVGIDDAAPSGMAADPGWWTAAVGLALLIVYLAGWGILG